MVRDAYGRCAALFRLPQRPYRGIRTAGIADADGDILFRQQRGGNRLLAGITVGNAPLSDSVKAYSGVLAGNVGAPCGINIDFFRQT